jgi:hypothetical protein
MRPRHSECNHGPGIGIRGRYAISTGIIESSVQVTII